MNEIHRSDFNDYHNYHYDHYYNDYDDCDKYLYHGRICTTWTILKPLSSILK